MLAELPTTPATEKYSLSQVNAKTELNLTYTYGQKHASNVAENVTNSIRLH